MADYTYNVTVAFKSPENLYYENRSIVTGLNPLFASGGLLYLGNYYIYQGVSGALSGIFNIDDFNRNNLSALADNIYIWTGNNSSNFGEATQFYPRSTTNEWRKLGETTNYNSFPIQNNYIIGIKLYSGYTKTIHPSGGIFENYSCFYIDNVKASGLFMEKGKTYQFVQTQLSNSGNPLNIYLDEYGNKKLTKYVTVSGVAGANRYVTVSIPKSFKETNTLYYGNESGEFFGAPIKLISNEYYLKHNIKLICLDVKHDGTKYIIPDNLLDQKFINYYNNENYFALTSGIFSFISTPDGQNIGSSTLITRKDTLAVNLVGKNAGLIDSNFDINYFGNVLTYKRTNATGINEWSNLSDLYWLLNDRSFSDSGRIDDFSAKDKEYNQYGYLLSGCEGCINKITLATGEGNVYSGTFEIYYNPINLVNDITANSFLNTTTGNIQNEDFITFDNIGAVTYSKSFYNDTSYSIPRKI